MGDRLGGVTISRSQVLEVLVNRALPLVEAEYVLEGGHYSPEEVRANIRQIANELTRIRKLPEQLPKDE